MKTIELQNNLQLAAVERPIPEPKHSDEVLVKIHACGFNPVDYKFANGKIPTSLPVVLGHEFSGTIASANPFYPEGTPVFGYLPGPQINSNGAFAEYVAVSTAFIAPAPQSISLTEAAAYPLTALTAMRCMTHVSASGNPKAFLTGATGGVGFVLLQMLLHQDIDVYALVRSNKNKEELLQHTTLTANKVIVAETAATADENQFDYTFDLIGGDYKQLCLKLTAMQGHMATIVEEKNFPVDIWDARQSPTFQKSLCCHFVFLGSEAYFGSREQWRIYQRDLLMVKDLLEENSIHYPRIEIIEDFSLENVKSALSRLEKRTLTANNSNSDSEKKAQGIAPDPA